MKRYLLSLILFLLLVSTIASQSVEKRELGQLVFENIPVIPETIQEKLTQYSNVRSAGLCGWMPADGSLLITTRFGETRQVHRVEKPGGMRQQLTFYHEPVAWASACPNAETPGFMFMKDVGGAEFYQIFFYDLRLGTWSMITDGNSRNGSVCWSSDGKEFAYYSTQRNGKDWDIYSCAVNNLQESRLVYEADGSFIPVAWSPDKSKLMLQNYVSINESYLYILDIETGKTRLFNPAREKTAYGSVVWSENGKGIFYTSDEKSEFLHLRYYELKTGKTQIITKDIPWDAEGLTQSRQGDQLVFKVNEGGLHRLYLMDAQTFKYRLIKNIPQGVIASFQFHPEGRSLAFSVNSASTSGDIFVKDFENEQVIRWTESEIGGLNPDTFVHPKLIHYFTFDKVNGKPREIPAFYYHPTDASDKVPVVLYIHGGPESQYVPYFSSTIQYMVNELHVAVIAPNVRGSAGYGKSYLLLDNAYKREDSVKDIGKLLDWIEKQPELDKNRVAVYGGSYGGYMVLASMVHYNNRLTCGIDVVGISNFNTFLKNTKDYRRDLRRAEYGDERDPEMKAFLEKISPGNHAEKITKPMLVIQGLNDPRVPVTESEQFVEAIRENGGDVWYLLAKDEGHGFRKKTNRDYYLYTMMLFLEKHLIK